jgi:PKD repeat protein
MVAWVCPAGVLYLDLVLQGAGGGGGGGGTSSMGGGGGQAGGTVTVLKVPVIPGTSYNLVYGAAGVGGGVGLINGGDGGASSAFGYSAPGGAGGTRVGYSGTAGQNGFGTGGGTGGTYGDDGGPGGAGANATTGTPGAGGGGGGGAADGTPGIGGNGGAGNIYITYVLPVPTLGVDPTAGSAPLDVTFTGSATGSPTAYDWDFGDGSAHVYTQNTSHTYATPGQRTSALKVSNAYGFAMAYQVITVYWLASAQGYIITADDLRRP